MRAIQIIYSNVINHLDTWHLPSRHNVLQFADFPKDAKVEFVEDLVGVGRRFIISSSQYEDRPLETILAEPCYSPLTYIKTIQLPSGKVGQIASAREISQEAINAIKAAGIIGMSEFPQMSALTKEKA